MIGSPRRLALKLGDQRACVGWACLQWVAYSSRAHPALPPKLLQTTLGWTEYLAQLVRAVLVKASEMEHGKTGRGCLYKASD